MTSVSYALHTTAIVAVAEDFYSSFSLSWLLLTLSYDAFQQTVAQYDYFKASSLSSPCIMVYTEARAAAVPEAVSLPAAQVPPTDSGCQHQLLHHSQAEHLPGKWIACCYTCS